MVGPEAPPLPHLTAAALLRRCTLLGAAGAKPAVSRSAAHRCMLSAGGRLGLSVALSGSGSGLPVGGKPEPLCGLGCRAGRSDRSVGTAMARALHQCLRLRHVAHGAPRRCTWASGRR